MIVTTRNLFAFQLHQLTIFLHINNKEFLFCQVFDLKGSLRNRNVKTDTGKESCDVVLLDENLLKMVRDNPLYIRSHSKSVLRTSIHSDAHFLSSHLIIDYSLLVGRDDTSNELVVGIIGKSIIVPRLQITIKIRVKFQRVC